MEFTPPHPGYSARCQENNFVNTKATSLPRTFGIYQINSGGLFSANTFTDITYSIYLNSAVFSSIIENVEIEVNVSTVSPLSTIYVDNCTVL